MPNLRGRASLLRLSLGIAGTAALLAVAFSRPSPPAATLRRAQYRMGTVLEIDAAGSDRAALERAVEDAFASVGGVEDRLSNWRPDSELSRANHAGAVPFRVSAETFWSLSAALRLAAETAGAFDPSVGSVTEPLGLTGALPDPARARAGTAAVGWRRVRLDPAARTVTLLASGAELDSGAFGKGEALDRAAQVLRRRGAVAASLNFGGQILLFGTESREGLRAGWNRVVVAAPDAAGTPVCELALGDGSISTSGDAEKPGHLIDPRTGRAAAFHGSVTVVADTALRADALSTALFVMGPDAGLAFARERGIPALYLSTRPGVSPLLTSPAFDRLSPRALRRGKA
jgi:thiamine biosynthesis lipoprotein